MKRNTVSPEMYAKMVAAGWTGPIPDAQEVADKLPRPIAINVYSSGRVSVSHAGNNNFVKSVPSELSVADALGALYLKLKETPNAK